MTRALAAVILSAAPIAAAFAQPARTQPVEEIAADLAYGFCPLFLAGRFALNSPELAQRGFGSTVLRQPHPRIGEMSLVSAKLPDGEISFGGASGKACTVVVKSAKPAVVLDKLHASMAFMGLDFQPAAAPGPAVAGVPASAVETFRAPVEKQFLYVQIVRVDGGRAGPAAVVAQLFVTDR
jgi:hypothetical protein